MTTRQSRCAEAVPSSGGRSESPLWLAKDGSSGRCPGSARGFSFLVRAGTRGYDFAPSIIRSDLLFAPSSSRRSRVAAYCRDSAIKPSPSGFFWLPETAATLRFALPRGSSGVSRSRDAGGNLPDAYRPQLSCRRSRAQLQRSSRGESGRIGGSRLCEYVERRPRR